MKYWSGGFVVDLGWVALWLLLARILLSAIPSVARLRIPEALVAGVIGFLLGPSMLGWAQFDPFHLEAVVYHSLGIVFIAVALQRPARGGVSGDALSLAFAIPMLAVLQGLIGLLFALAWTAAVEPMHPGFGLLLPLGFSQGPGQALSIGMAMQESGLQDGAQIGLIFAALGFGSCCIAGVPLAAVARAEGAAVEPSGEGAPSTELTLPIAVIGSLYLATFGVLVALAQVVPDKQLPLVFGFHFLIASFLAMFVRAIWTRTKAEALDDDALGRIATLVVDLGAACALAAVSAEVLGRHLVPLALLCTIAAATTLAVCWFGQRWFREAPLAHAVTLFGTSTGTLSTGLALLRMLDPDLEGPVARNMVLAATGAIVFGAPLLLVVLPMPIADPSVQTAWVAAGLCAGYLAVLVAGWWFAAKRASSGSLGG